MSRKRKSDQEQIVETVSEQPPTETPTAVAEPAVAEAQGSGQTFADKVGKKTRTTAPDPSGIAKDNLAGVRLLESKQDRQMAIKFGSGRPEDKPSQAVIDTMKQAGYQWKTLDRIWAHPVRPDSARSTRIEAEQLYQKVRQMIRKEKGIETEQEVPF